MTISRKQWDVAFSIIQKFERQLVSPGLFSWDYFIKESGISKPTLWRNKDFVNELLPLTEN